MVTTRSVLIYLMDKAPAFREFHRVLRGGGRLSIFEPINVFGYEESRGLYYGLDVSPVQHLADKIIARWKTPDEHPLLNFDERDLFRFAREAGFEEVRMDYRAELSARPAAIRGSAGKRSGQAASLFEPKRAQVAALASGQLRRAEDVDTIAAQLNNPPLKASRRSVHRRRGARARAPPFQHRHGRDREDAGSPG